jgi:hypothetical protein
MVSPVPSHAVLQYLLSSEGAHPQGGFLHVCGSSAMIPPDWSVFGRLEYHNQQTVFNSEELPAPHFQLRPRSQDVSETSKTRLPICSSRLNYVQFNLEVVAVATGNLKIKL